MSGAQTLDHLGGESRLLEPGRLHQARRGHLTRHGAIVLGALCIVAFECSQFMYLASVGTSRTHPQALLARATAAGFGLADVTRES